MGVIVVLIAFSLLVALTFLGAFFWAVKSGQFDDQETPSIRMLFEDGTSSSSSKKTNKSTLTNHRD